MAEDATTMLADVARYYASKLEAHGTTARGVDWNGEAGQALRFDQLVRIVNAADPFSINDLGCGYGALLDYLDARGFKTTPASTSPPKWCARPHYVSKVGRTQTSSARRA